MSKCIILTKHTKARMTTLSMQQNDHYTQSNYPTCALSMITGPKELCRGVGLSSFCLVQLIARSCVFERRSTFNLGIVLSMSKLPLHSRLASELGIFCLQSSDRFCFCISLSSPCCLPSGTAADDVLLNLTNAS